MFWSDDSEDQIPSTREVGQAKPNKNRRSFVAGRFPYALAALVKRPQAAAQIGAYQKVGCPSGVFKVLGVMSVRLTDRVDRSVSERSVRLMT